MAGNVGVFHVEFGFNDTSLTRALESGNYALAEKHIREVTNPSSLDEGCYQRTPLYICLSGLDSEEIHPRPRNLYLAKLLIERGANVNYRVPTTYFGCEYTGPGQSPLELLIKFYIDLTGFSNTEPIISQIPGKWPSYHGDWDPTVDIVIGINKQFLHTREAVIEHLEHIVFIILGAGGDAGIQDESRKTALHRLASSSHDVRLFKLLCESGANINSQDCKGNSPLLSLCDFATSEMYEFMEDLSPTSTDTIEDTSANLIVDRDFLSYVLQQKDLQINIQNHMGHSALFHCVIRGDVQAAQMLLKHGANPALRGTVWETRKRKRRVSPLLASFLSIPLQRSLTWQNMHSQVTMATRQYAHLVDTGYFSQHEIQLELVDLLTGEFPEFSHLTSLGAQLVPLMFGQTSASLKQLATRAIFKQCFVHQKSCITKLLPVDVIKQTVQEDTDNHTYEDYINFILNKTVLETLLKRLGLPKDFLAYFEVELFLHRVAYKMSSMKAKPPENIFCDSDGSLSDLSDESTLYSEEGGDSDLEYW